MGNLVKSWIAGQGMLLDAGYMSQEEIAQFNTLSPDARKQFVDEFIAKYPAAFRLTAGYCKGKKIHVTEQECLACSKAMCFTDISLWEECRKQNLSRI